MAAPTNAAEKHELATGELPKPVGPELSQRQIEAAVRKDLWEDPVVTSEDLNVSAANDIIALRGSQPTLLARDRAANVAETVRGVRRVVNRINVRSGRDVDSQRLESDITYALLTDPATERDEIIVEADGSGRVELRGVVDRGAERHLAEQTAKRIVGVRQLTNNIEVVSQAERPDPEIVEDVCSTLRWDAYVDSRAVKVTAKKGVVTLAGSVDSAAQRKRAFELSWVAGVRQVNIAQLKVSPMQLHDDASAGFPVDVNSDEAIAAAVRRKLAADPRLRDSEIDVSVAARVVTLDGIAATLKAKHIADRTPFGLLGVTSVRDRLRVSDAMGAYSDEELSARINRALSRNSTTAGDDVDVTVRDGAVTLSGSSDSWYSRRIAADLAASVRGVHAVTNKIILLHGGERPAYDPYTDEWSGAYYDRRDRMPKAVGNDRDIAESVRRELWWSPLVDQADIAVSAKDALVTLTGTVDSLAERDAAIENAFEGGAMSVRSALVLRE